MILDKSTNFCCGTIVTDKYLGLKVADDDFCHFVGDVNVGNLAKSAHPDDLGLITDAVNNVSLEEPSLICYRIMTADGTYHHVVAKFFYEDSKARAFGAIRATFTDLYSIADRMNEAEKYIRKLECYLDLMGVLLYEYDKRTEHFLMYTGSKYNRIVVFDDAVNNWINVCNRLPVSDEDKDKIEGLICHLKADKGDFEDEVCLPENAMQKMPNLPEYFVGRKIRVKGSHISDELGPRVQGYLYAVDNTTVGVSGILDGSMDTSLNIYNKKSITEYAKRQIDRGKSGYIVILDVDHFKSVNDTYGHLFGDEVLASVTTIIKDNIIGKGIVGRIGGDEFMIVIDRRCSHGDLRGILRGIRSTVQYDFEEDKADRPACNVTVTMGICEYGENIKNYEDCFKIADKMLYCGKEKGRNRYIIYEPEIHGDVLSIEPQQIEEHLDNSSMSKDQFMMSFFNLFVVRKTMPYALAISTLMQVFQIDEAVLFKQNLSEPKYWEGKDPNVRYRRAEFAACDSFQRLYRDTGIAVINHAIDLKVTCPEAYEYMVSSGYEAMIGYRSSTPDNAIIFGRTSKKTRKWEESDISYLNFVAQLMDLEFENR